MKDSIRRNSYDYFLIILIISTIYGRWGLLHPTTFLAIFFLPKLFESFHLIAPYVKNISLFFSFWLLYAFLSLLWVYDMSNAYLDLFLLFVHFALFLEIVVFAFKANHPVKSIAYAWAFAFFLTSIVGLWEIFTNNHLDSAREESEYYYHSATDYFLKQYATVTFYNPNTYCVFICMSFPFILYLLGKSRKRQSLFCNIILVFLAVYIISRDSSRGGLTAMAIMLTVYLAFKIRYNSERNRFYTLLGVFIIALLIYNYGDSFFASILFRLEGQDLLESDARMVLISSSWHLFLESYGFGKGVGSMMYALGNTATNTTNYLYSHNMVMEILLEYGFFIASGFVFYMLCLLFHARKLDNTTKSLVIGAVLSFPFYSVINSENLRPHFIWIFFASLYVISKYGLNNKLK